MESGYIVIRDMWLPDIVEVEKIMIVAQMKMVKECSMPFNVVLCLIDEYK